MRLLKLWLLYSTSLVLGVAAILFVAVAVLLSTHSGTRWSLDKADALLEAELSVPEFSGSLWGGLTVPSLTYRDDTLEIIASNLDLALDWRVLFAGQVTVDHLAASSLELRSVDPSSEPQPFELAMQPATLWLNIRALEIADVTYRSGDEVTTISSLRARDLYLHSNRIGFDTADFKYDDVSVALEDLQATLAGDVPLSVNATWQLGGTTWSGQAELRGSLGSLEFRHLLRGELEATIAGSAKVLHETTPQIRATARWQEWSVVDIRTSIATIDVAGTANDYQLAYKLTVEDAAGRSADIDGKAQGNLSGLQSFQATAASVIGKVEAAGNISWSPDVALDVQLQGTGLDLSGIDARLESALDIDVSVRVTGDDYIGIGIRSIKGTYANLDAAASGSIERRSNTWLCQDCVLQLGQNQVTASGTMQDDNIDFQWAITAPTLAELWPGLDGQLNASGLLSGTIEDPKVSLDATASSLSLDDLHIEEVVLHAAPSSLARIDLDLTAKRIGYAEQALGDLSLALGGDIKNQRSTIHWSMDDLSADLQVATIVADAVTSGVIEQGSITLPVVGTWTLLKSAVINVVGSDVQISEHEWQNADGKLGIESATVTTGNLSIAAALQQIPLSLLAGFMPQEGEVLGTADVTVQLRQEGEQWFGVVQAHVDDAMIRIVDHADDTVEIEIPRADFGAELLGKGATIHASLAIAGGFTSEMQATLSSLDQSADIEGRLRLQGSDWYWVHALVPTLDDVKGNISADLSARGSVLKPALTGELTINGGALVVPSLNVPLEAINIRIRGADDGSATLVGSMRAGSGALAFDGQVTDLFLDTRRLEAHVTGVEAEVINWPEYRAWASPDITLRGDQRGWSVRGSLEVPKAEIKIREIPEGSVAPSPDVVVVGRSDSNGQPLPVSGKVAIVIGKGVHIEALGLDTKLDGNLDATMPRKGAPQLAGRLNLREGKFAAYGQKLTIDNGSLTFTGPVDDPIVDVRAGKIIESVDGNVEAGIELRGRAQNLTSSVYSVPKMSESDALSYLVLGHGLDQASGTDGSQVNNAALALGLSQATRITNQVGQSVGLDQLALSGGTNETAALVAGKQLNDRLYVRYAYGVFSQIGTLLMRYRLSKRLTLEAGSAEGQSMEILYTVEKP